MNILYLADINSTHDIKWMSYFVNKKIGNLYVLTRSIHRSTEFNLALTWVGEIPDFSHIRFYKTLFTAYRIKRHIKKYKIDLIHILYTEPNALWCMFRRYFEIPIILTCRGTDVLKTIPETFEKKNLINLLVARSYKLAFNRADWITCTSQSQIKSVAAFSSRYHGVSLIRTGVDIERLKKDTSLYYTLDEQVKYFLFPRYMTPLYQHEFCLNAIALLEPDLKEKYAMVFIGKDAGDLKYQEEILQLMGEQTDVRFVFLPMLSQEQLFELYKRATLVIMTPKSDGSPVSAMEAAVCGAKVILPPLEYDLEVFDDYFFKLARWKAEDLAMLIERAVYKDKPVLPELTKFDRRFYMERLWNIYLEVTRNMAKSRA